MTVDQLLPVETLALTMWGEARGEPVEGQIAVGNVIMNRFLSNPKKYETVKGVCLERNQFSCWNSDDPNRALILEVAEEFHHPIIKDAMLRQCRFLANGIMGGMLVDVTSNALNYMTNKLFNGPHRPEWARIPKDNPIIIGNHTFFTA